VEPLGELTVQWSGNDFGDDNLASLGDEWGGEEKYAD
jgi:hypothetical protein